MAAPLDPVAALEAAFRARGSVLVAYSGGVDSAVLAAAGARALGDRSLAVVVDSESYPRSELDAALDLARGAGFPVEVVAHSELADPAYVANAPDRCYHCRRGMTDTLSRVAATRGFGTVAFGTTTDDLGDVRPGLRALAEAEAWQPFLELGIDKAGVRALAQALGLPAWDKPSMACLSSRIPHGEPVTEAKLRRIERAEAAVRALGFRQVRVRSLGGLARVEVEPEAVARAAGLEPRLRELLLAEGYETVEVDARGYRTGALNAIRVRPRSA